MYMRITHPKKHINGNQKNLTSRTERPSNNTGQH